MRFSPKSEAELQKENNKFFPWPQGVYDFEVVDASDEISSKGNEMIKMTLHVFNADGDRRTVFDYLMDKMLFKLRHAAAACGVLSKYEKGALDAHDFHGKTGQLKLGIDPAKDGYDAKNKVLDYIEPVEKTSAAPRRPAAAPALRPVPQMATTDLDDEIPF